MKLGCCLAMALLLSPLARSQPVEKVQPATAVRNALLSKPIGIAREVGATAQDFAMFRDPQWSVLTIGQIGAASADAATSLNNLRSCLHCSEIGPSRFFIGRHPDAHKYIIGGIVEIGVEAVAAHYFRNHGPKQKLYWRILWALPQSFSLYEHAFAAERNSTFVLGCSLPGSLCK